MSEEWGGYSSWSTHDLSRAPALVSPARVLWASYSKHCALWGFPRAQVADFVHWLRGEEGVTVRDAGGGRLGRMVVGLAPSGVCTDEQCDIDCRLRSHVTHRRAGT